MELYSMLCGSQDGRGVGGKMDTCICMAESLNSSHETITVLLIDYTQKQNKKFKIKKIKIFMENLYNYYQHLLKVLEKFEMKHSM